MPESSLIGRVRAKLDEVKSAGLWKSERLLTAPQAGHTRARRDVESVGLSGQPIVDRPILNLCANNYLGLADDARLVEAATQAMQTHGYGLASVRFICGTQDIHRQLEIRLAKFLGFEDAILYGSCFDANGGLFETLLDEADAVVSDQLNHASIIDGVRLCKAARFRFAHNDMLDLEKQLVAAREGGAKAILISTDGVFSMDGTIAQLSRIVELADRFDAMVHFDDCQATGFLGASGRGTHEHAGVMDRCKDRLITTGTLGKAVGGASGGYTAGSREVVDLLRQRSRPYLFSNSLAPAVVGGSLAAIEAIERGDDLRQRLWQNTAKWRGLLEAGGFELIPGSHPIVPVMFGDERRAKAFSEVLWEEGVLAVAFAFPVVPKGRARIRTQMSAGLTSEDLERAVEAFTRAKRTLG